jgi:hypothetical protein
MVHLYNGIPNPANPPQAGHRRDCRHEFILSLPREDSKVILKNIASELNETYYFRDVPQIPVY